MSFFFSSFFFSLKKFSKEKKRRLFLFPSLLLLLLLSRLSLSSPSPHSSFFLLSVIIKKDLKRETKSVHPAPHVDIDNVHRLERRVVLSCFPPLNRLDDVGASNDAPEHRVLAVKPRSGHGRDEELGAVGVRARVRHREGEGAVVFGHARRVGVRAKLVGKVAAPDGGASRAVSERAPACFVLFCFVLFCSWKSMNE